jgi:hypothetical protein
METVAVDYKDTQSRKAENERYYLLTKCYKESHNSKDYLKYKAEDYTFIFYAGIEPTTVEEPKTFTITERARCSQH